MIAQEDRPLAVVGDLRRLPHDVGDREAILARQRHIHARHQREMERHVAFVALAEILLGVLRPLVGFREKHAAGIGAVDLGADLLQNLVRLRQVLVVGALALDEVGHRIEPQAVDAHVEPEVHDSQHGLEHCRVVEVEIGLVGIEAVPEIGLGFGVPRPVGAQRIDEDDARAGIFLVAVGPDVEIALGRARRRHAGALEPGVLVGGMVDHQLGDDADAEPVGFLDQLLHVVEGAVLGMHRGVFGDVVAVILARRGIERQQPDRVDAQLGDIGQPGDQAGKIPDAVVVRIEERLHVELVDDRVLVPLRVGGDRQDGLVGDGCVHGALRGESRQMANGRAAGSSRRCWFLPCQAKRSPRTRSSTSSVPSSGSFHSHSGISKPVSCG